MGMWSGSSVRINDYRWRTHPAEEFLSWRKVVFSKQKGISESGGVRAFNRQWSKLAKKRGDWHMNEMITAKDASNYHHCGCWVEHCRCYPWNLAALELLPQGNIVCMYMYSMSSCIFTCNIRVIVIICALCCTYIFILHRLDSLLAEEALASCAAWQNPGCNWCDDQNNGMVRWWDLALVEWEPLICLPLCYASLLCNLQNWWTFSSSFW